MMKKILLSVIFSLVFLFPAFSQYTASKSIPQDWFLRDPEQDSLLGVSSERAYETLLKGQPSRTVIVAVIDSGIDIEHEDLKRVIWKNEKEIAGNGVDDDNNGYVDDVYGWNFIGGKNGNVEADTYELTREYIRLQAKYGSIEESKVNKKQKAEYESYLQIKSKFGKLKANNEQQYRLYANIYRNITHSIDTIKSIMKVEKLTAEEIQKFETKEPALLFAKGFLLNMYKNMNEGERIEDYIGELKEAVDYYEVIVKYGYNETFNSRDIVGDDSNNLYEKGYGNNDVTGADATHGTHVAGIIAADRTNNVGIKGIANNVKIMPIRAVPNGDERDKDVANAIIYAVDNGAHIINMSFGKSFSPQKDVVDKAVRYAEQKGVLLIHAAGNDGENSDEEKNYPTRFYNDGKEAKNWIEVGASAWGGEELVGSFSNYGKKTVAFFAPGVDVYSTVPGNKYKKESGTSMASPSTAGVAALIMSYFPELTAVEVKDVLMKSTRKFDNLQVQKPDGGKAKLDQLTITGGLLNAYDAVKLAQTLSLQKQTAR
ncbi:MAG TPA: S8 family peptidase [Cyclobacteriaceae bacterium]|jgi:cell wall-associated protease|nr:S8 family peptidase [Cyclobacteriaceae bacterium]HRF34726.1 S8 family peptidase [Cyclobacteriaceae bacterium]